MTLRLVPPIHRATHRIGLYLGRLGRRGLSQGEAHILARLAASAPAAVGDLHADLAHKRSTLTSILDRLAARGFVTREVGAADRRTFVVHLTPSGRRAAREVGDHLAALEAAVGRQVTGAEMRACLKVLSVVESQARESTRAARSRR